MQELSEAPFENSRSAEFSASFVEEVGLKEPFQTPSVPTATKNISPPLKRREVKELDKKQGGQKQPQGPFIVSKARTSLYPRVEIVSCSTSEQSATFPFNAKRKQKQKN